MVLPARARPDQAAENGSPLPAGLPERRRILVVDDEPAIGHSMRRLLSARHDVVAVESGGAALALIAGGHRFDVLLCDLLMPSMTGMELHAHLAKVRPELTSRMIFMTGGPFGQGVREFLASVPNERIDKPFEAEELDPLLDRAQAKVRA